MPPWRITNTDATTTISYHTAGVVAQLSWPKAQLPDLFNTQENSSSACNTEKLGWPDHDRAGFESNTRLPYRLLYILIGKVRPTSKHAAVCVCAYKVITVDPWSAIRRILLYTCSDQQWHHSQPAALLREMLDCCLREPTDLQHYQLC